MAFRYNLAGKLVVGNNTMSPIRCQVELKVELLDLQDESSISQNFIGGVKVTGEISYCDANPPKINLNPGLGHNNDLRLTVFNPAAGISESIYSEFNIVLFEKMGSTDRGRDRVYFWQFTNIGAPLSDHLGLFPTDYTFKNNKRVFICRDFRGEWPCPVLAMVVALNKFEAKRLLKNKLTELKIPFFGYDGFTLEEIHLNDQVILFQDGNQGV